MAHVLRSDGLHACLLTSLLTLPGPSLLVGGAICDEQGGDEPADAQSSVRVGAQRRPRQCCRALVHRHRACAAGTQPNPLGTLP